MIIKARRNLFEKLEILYEFSVLYENSSPRKYFIAMKGRVS